MKNKYKLKTKKQKLDNISSSYSLHYACNNDTLGCLTRMPFSLPNSSQHKQNPPIKPHPPPHFSLPPVVIFKHTQKRLSSFYSVFPSFCLLGVCCFVSEKKMAVSGFEGFEKRLELNFYQPHQVKNIDHLGLRLLDFESLEQVLHAVQCTVVSAVGNHYFDAYVLSESSLFVYPTKIIIKTCGTTQLLKSIRPLIRLAAENLGLTLCGCRYTRGSFIFPKAQPFPHTHFKEEVIYIEENLPKSLCYRKASVMPSKLPSYSWHVFTAGMKYNSPATTSDNDLTFTIEVCMTELDRVQARKFFKKPGGVGVVDAVIGGGGGYAGKEMTELTGINNINPGAIICDFEFDPCGYSMNGIDGDRYSTIHVTPEDGYSYASYEFVGCVYDEPDDVVETLNKAVQVFKPATVSVSTTSHSHEVWTMVARAMEPLGLKCRSSVMDEFPSAGSIVFQTFTAARRK